MIDETGTMISSKPYLIRAIYEWILDNQMTPHLVVDANFPGASVPQEFVDEGRIVLNIAPGAVRGLVIGNDWIQFNARFGGVAREVMVPSEAVTGIFTRENGQGMVFPEPDYPSRDRDVDVPLQGPAPVLKAIEDTSTAPAGSDLPDSQTVGKGKGKGRGPTLKLVK